MKRKKKTSKEETKGLDEMERDIDGFIDDIAYLDERQNIKRSKSFLDNMYLLNQES